MNTTQLRKAILVILILSLPAVSAGQVKDCTERSCETTFDNLIRNNACGFVAATINNDPEMISNAVAGFVTVCTTWEYDCEKANDGTLCKRQISWERVGTRESSGGEHVANNGCPIRVKNVADGGCFTTEVVNTKDCVSIKAGACRNTAQCDDQRDIFGSFTAMCHSGGEPGCPPVMSVVADIRSTAYSRHASYLGRVNARLESLFGSLSNEQKSQILSDIEGIEMFSNEPERLCYENFLEGAIEPSAPTVETLQTSTEILVRAEIDGYESADQTWVMLESAPSSINVSGTVKDQAGKPIPNTLVSLPDLGVIVATNILGEYRLHGEADGSEPFTGVWNFVLTKRVGEIEIEVTLPPKPLALNTRAANWQPLTVKLLDCTDRRTRGGCVPLVGGRVEIEAVSGSNLPAIQIQGSKGRVDSAGTHTAALQLSSIDTNAIDFQSLWQSGAGGSAPPLTIELAIKAFPPDSSSPKKEETISVPLDLMMIRGTTVDGILLPRTEKDAPVLSTKPRSWIASQLSKEEDGVFYVLLQPSVVAAGDPTLIWKNTCNLQMNLPFSYLETVRGIEPRFEPGAMIDIGIIDLLSPNEHEFRLRQWVREFLHGLGFDNGQLGWAIDSLSVLDVQYDVPDVPVPRYGMNAGMQSMIGMAGVIQVGQGDHQYWGAQAFVDLDDTPYAIFLHELGHYVHKKIGDRWIEACLWDKKFAGVPDHSTWQTPNAKKLVSVEQAKMMTSFFEGTADFFAYSMFKFIEAKHPEMKDSLYFNRGYLEQFDTDDGAMAALHLGGCRVEGIQTSFFRELYEPYLESQSARAFGDLLRMMDAYKKESWIMRWVPSRTIVEWAAMKKKHGGLTPSSNLDGLIAKYGVNSCDVGIMVVPADPRKAPKITIDGRPITMEKASLVQSLSIGQTVTVEQGLITVIVQIWDSSSPTKTFAAGSGTSFKILAADTVNPQIGTLAVDGKIAIQTLGGTITPSGTSFMVTVDADGTAKASVIDGVISIATRKRDSKFVQGQAASLNPKGKVVELPDFDPTSVQNSFISVVPVGPAPKAPETAAPAPRISEPSDQTPEVIPVSEPKRESPSDLTFFSLRRKTTSECVVVAGIQGIAPGDTVFGSFPTFEQAQQALTKRCIDEPSAATPSGVMEEIGKPILAVPKYDGDQSTTGIFLFHLDDGTTYFIDKIKGEPLSYRRRTVNHNVFTALGRSTTKPAGPGHVLAGEIRSGNGNVKGIFLVDSTTGSVAYFDDLGSDSHRATLQRVNGRPAASIASDDGNFALIMRRDGSGDTDGAYLYHATTGQCVYFAHVDEMNLNPAVLFTTPLPAMEGRVVAVELQNGNEATPQALLIDGGSGRVYRVGELERKPAQVTVEQLPINLFEFFPASPTQPVPERFVLVPGFSDNGATDSVFILDAASGRMAVLKNIRRGGEFRLDGSSKSLHSHLPEHNGPPRVLTAAPKVGASGTTNGAWVFDSASGEVLFLENIRGPQNLTIHRATELVQ